MVPFTITGSFPFLVRNFAPNFVSGIVTLEKSRLDKLLSPLILISSLQLSSDLKPFEEIAKMLPWATKIEVCPAVCTICGADAYYTYKKDGNFDGEIEVGGKELYEPRCSVHHSHDMKALGA